MNEQIIDKAIEYIQELFRADAGGHGADHTLGHRADAGGHGADHTLRVWRNTLKLADTIPECDRTAAALAALLHDADDYKLFATEDNANARAFLRSQEVPDDEIDRICRIINSVSFSKNRARRPDTIEGQVVQDADRLDAIGAVGIARVFAFGGERGRPLQESVQHFYDKLLLLKDLMNTDAGKALAAKRHAFLEEYLRELDEELE